MHPQQCLPDLSAGQFRELNPLKINPIETRSDQPLIWLSSLNRNATRSVLRPARRQEKGMRNAPGTKAAAEHLQPMETLNKVQSLLEKCYRVQ